MEENVDPNLNVYRAMQVEENGLLKKLNTGRASASVGNGNVVMSSSYNQELFIGINSHPRPTKRFVKLHELLARIIHLRGSAEFYQDNSDDEKEIDDF